MEERWKRKKREENRFQFWLREKREFRRRLAEELYQTGDYYKNGFKKWSKFPLSSRVSLIVSLISLAVALGMLLWR